MSLKEQVARYLITVAQHYRLRYGVNLGLHIEVVGAQMDDEHTEIGTTQVQGQKFPLFWNKFAFQSWEQAINLKRIERSIEKSRDDNEWVLNL